MTKKRYLDTIVGQYNPRVDGYWNLREDRYNDLVDERIVNERLNRFPNNNEPDVDEKLQRVYDEQATKDLRKALGVDNKPKNNKAKTKKVNSAKTKKTVSTPKKDTKVDTTKQDKKGSSFWDRFGHTPSEILRDYTNNNPQRNNRPNTPKKDTKVDTTKTNKQPVKLSSTSPKQTGDTTTTTNTPTNQINPLYLGLNRNSEFPTQLQYSDNYSPSSRATNMLQNYYINNGQGFTDAYSDEVQNSPIAQFFLNHARGGKSMSNIILNPANAGNNKKLSTIPPKSIDWDNVGGTIGAIAGTTPRKNDKITIDDVNNALQQPIDPLSLRPYTPYGLANILRYSNNYDPRYKALDATKRYYRDYGYTSNELNPKSVLSLYNLFLNNVRNAHNDAIIGKSDVNLDYINSFNTRNTKSAVGKQSGVMKDISSLLNDVSPTDYATVYRNRQLRNQDLVNSANERSATLQTAASSVIPATYYGDTIPMTDGTYMLPESVLLSQHKFEPRNRGDYRTRTNVHGLNIKTFEPFVEYNRVKDKFGNNRFLGVSPNGSVKVGKLEDFKQGDKLTPMISYNGVTGIKRDNTGNIAYTQANRNGNQRSPMVSLENNTTMRLPFLLQSSGNSDDTYGKTTGGSIIIEAGGEQRHISGSINNIDKEIQAMKKRHKVKSVRVYLEDNGTYTTGLLTRNRTLNRRTLKNWDLRNVSG